MQHAWCSLFSQHNTFITSYHIYTTSSGFHISTFNHYAYSFTHAYTSFSQYTTSSGFSYLNHVISSGFHNSIYQLTRIQSYHHIFIFITNYKSIVYRKYTNNKPLIYHIHINIYIYIYSLCLLTITYLYINIFIMLINFAIKVAIILNIIY